MGPNPLSVSQISPSLLLDLRKKSGKRKLSRHYGKRSSKRELTSETFALLIKPLRFAELSMLFAAREFPAGRVYRIASFSSAKNDCDLRPSPGLWGLHGTAPVGRTPQSGSQAAFILHPTRHSAVSNASSKTQIGVIQRVKSGSRHLGLLSCRLHGAAHEMIGNPCGWKSNPKS